MAFEANGILKQAGSTVAPTAWRNAKEVGGILKGDKHIPTLQQYSSWHLQCTEKEPSRKECDRRQCCVPKFLIGNLIFQNDKRNNGRPSMGASKWIVTTSK